MLLKYPFKNYIYYVASTIVVYIILKPAPATPRKVPDILDFPNRLHKLQEFLLCANQVNFSDLHLNSPSVIFIFHF